MDRNIIERWVLLRHELALAYAVGVAKVIAAAQRALRELGQAMDERELAFARQQYAERYV